MRKFFITLCVCALLCACNTIPTKEAPVSQSVREPLTHKQHFNLGVAAMKRMDKKISMQDMDLALHHFGILFDEQPYNVIYQQNYYRLLFTYDYAIGKPSQKLIYTYDHLNWAVKKMFNPPTFIDYLISEVKGKDTKELIPMLLGIISERPDSAYLWNKLSILYEDSNLGWLAVAAAKQANMLENDNPEYLYQLGDSINDVIQSQACVYDEKVYAISAVKHIAKAAAKKPNQLYLDNTGLQYLRLGLLPLALQSIQKAYTLEKNEWTLEHYIQVLLLLERYEQAVVVVGEYIDLINQDDVLEAEALIAASRGNWKLAGEKMAELVVTDKSIQANIIAQWVLERGGEVVLDVGLGKLSAGNPWEQSILKYFSLASSGEQVMEDNYLISQARNGCERTEAYFYTAYRYWKNKNMDEAKKLLAMTQEQTATMYMEYMWSQLLEKNL